MEEAINTTTAIARPSADDFLSIIRRQQLGKLKVYLGACAGVGKTYAMLREGHRLKERGVDVVIGYVEPHERSETIAQIADLEVVPPRVITIPRNLVARNGCELRDCEKTDRRTGRRVGPYECA